MSPEKARLAYFQYHRLKLPLPLIARRLGVDIPTVRRVIERQTFKSATSGLAAREDHAEPGNPVNKLDSEAGTLQEAGQAPAGII